MMKILLYTLLLIPILFLSCGPSAEESEQQDAGRQEQLTQVQEDDPAPEVEKFGLSMEERKAIFVELYKKEVEARKKADAKYPMTTAEEAKRDAESYAIYKNELMDEMQKEIMKKHMISDSVYWEIATEGVELNWIPAGVY